MSLCRFAACARGVVLVAVMLTVVIAAISTVALLRVTALEATATTTSELEARAAFVAQGAVEIAKATFVYQPVVLDASGTPTVAGWNTYMSTYADDNPANVAVAYGPDPAFRYRFIVQNNIGPLGNDPGGTTKDLDGVVVVTATAYGPSATSVAYQFQLRRPSFADYQWVMGQQAGSEYLYDAAETFTGKFHHNGAITFDLTQPIAFQEFAAATGVSPASTWAPYGYHTSPDAPTFAAGKDFQAPPVTLPDVAQTFDQLRTAAQANTTGRNKYLRPPLGKQLLLDFRSDGTVALRELRVLEVGAFGVNNTVYHYGGPMTGWIQYYSMTEGWMTVWHEEIGLPVSPPRVDFTGTTPSGIPYEAMVSEDVADLVGSTLNGGGWQTVSIWNQADIDLIFIEGDVRLMGTVTNRLTVAAADDVYVVGDLLYQDLQQDVLGVLAFDNVFFETRAVVPGDETLANTATTYLHAAVLAGGQRLVTKAQMTANKHRLYTFGSMTNVNLAASPLEGNAWQAGIVRQYDPYLAQKYLPYFPTPTNTAPSIVKGSFHRLRELPALPAANPTPDPLPKPPPPNTTPRLQ